MDAQRVMSASEATLPKPVTIDSLVERILARAAKHPERIALVETGGAIRRALFGKPRTISYGELSKRIRSVTHGLRKRGLAPGDRVVYGVRPGIDSFVLIAGLLRAGASVIAVDPGVGPDLFHRRMQLAKPSWVVAESIFFAAGAPGPVRWGFGQAGLALPDVGAFGTSFVHVGPRLPGVPANSVPQAELLETEPVEEALPRLSPDRVVLTIFTSGTTSDPKGVEHTAKSLGTGSSLIAELMSLRNDDVVYSTQTHQMLSALLAGARCVIPPLRPDPRRFVADVERLGVTHTYGVPFEVARVVDELEKNRKRLPDSLRVMILGSAPIHRSFLGRLRSVIGEDTDVHCAYAMTEMLPVSVVESREKLAYEGGGDLVGRPVKGAFVAVAEDGELHVTGENLCRGYLGKLGTAWHGSGDLARVDDDGRIVLLGRKKDMIIRGHHNLYPSLYEDKITALPGVSRCAFLGIDTEDHADERVVLAVEPLPGRDPEAVRLAVLRAIDDGSAGLDTFAKPDHVVACAMPHGGRSNKLDRVRLRSEIAEKLAHGRL